MFCCLKMRWENLITFCEERPSWHRVSILSIVGGGLITRMGVGEPVPVLGKDLFENVPVPRGCCKHEGAPSGGEKIDPVKRFYHAFPASSTPHRSVYGHPHPP